MSNSATHLNVPPSFFMLSLRPQLFLWTIRHLVYAVRWHKPVCAHVQKTFDLAGIPELPAMIDDLLHTIAQNATRPIEVAHPQCKELLCDERLLVECLISFQSQSDRCECSWFSGMLRPDGLKNVMPRLTLIAKTMSNCQRMAPLFGANDDNPCCLTSSTIH